MLAAKRNAGRFTLQFNLNDPIQLLASTILENQGRHKAQYLSNAISYYQYHIDCLEQAQAKYMNMEKVPLRGNAYTPESIPSSMHVSHAKNDKNIHSQVGNNCDSDDSLDQYFEGTELPAIKDTLAAFCQKN